MSGHAPPEPFRETCGLDAPLRLSVEPIGGGPAEVWELPTPFAVIGRHEAADVCLDHPEVGTRHVYLQVFAGRAYALGLSNRGVSWGVQRRGSGWVPAGTAIRIGPYLVRPLLEEPDASAWPLADPSSRSFFVPGAADALLEFEGPGVESARWQVSRALVLIGRSPSCRLRLPGAGVSALHAALVRTASGLWLVDLLAPGGTTVEGRPVRSAALGDGDEVGIGPHRITVRAGVRLDGEPGSGRALATLGGTSAERFAPGSAESLMSAALVEQFARMQEQMADQFQQALMNMLRLFGAMHQDQMALLREEMAQLRALTEEQQALQKRLLEERPEPRPDPPPARLRLAPTDPSPEVGEPPAASPAPRPTPPPGRDEAARPASPDIHLQIERRLAAIRQEQQGRLQKLLGAMLGKGSG